MLARHAQSTLNVEHRVSGDPSLDVPLTEEGEAQARRLGAQLANLPLDACIHTQFSRTRLTAELALEGRQVELQTEPLLDDIKVGELEGLSVDEYRDWKARHDRGHALPGRGDPRRRRAPLCPRLPAPPRDRTFLRARRLP